MSARNEKIELTVTKKARRNVMVVTIIGIIIAALLLVLWGTSGALVFGIVGFVLLAALPFVIGFGLLGAHMRVAVKEHKNIKQMEEYVATRSPNNSYTVKGKFVLVEPRYDGSRVLNLTNNNLQSIKEIDGLQQNQHALKLLSLDHNHISKIEGLKDAHEIEQLWLHVNQIEKIEGLETLKYMKFLDLSNNKITKIEGLEDLEHLENIRLDGNPIQWPEGLSVKSTAKEIVAYCRKAAGKEPLKEKVKEESPWEAQQRMLKYIGETYDQANRALAENRVDEAIQLYQDVEKRVKKIEMNDKEKFFSTMAKDVKEKLKRAKDMKAKGIK